MPIFVLQRYTAYDVESGEKKALVKRILSWSNVGVVGLHYRYFSYRLHG